MSHSSKETYVRLLKKTLEQITQTPKSDPETFRKLKKKAEKYLVLAGGTLQKS